MPGPRLTRCESAGVTLLGDLDRPGGVTLAFTERTGGVSTGAFASLNLGRAVGDDPSAVAENHRRVLAAVGAQECEGSLICPKQVHRTHVAVIADASQRELSFVCEEVAAGADGVVCTVPDVPVLMKFADCVPVILVAEGGFAVVHSGWRGTIARIAGKAARMLAEATHTQRGDLLAYIGPHIGVGDYEVLAELAGQFAGEFGAEVVQGERQLDLGLAVERALTDVGVASERIAICDVSTASATDRFFSHRAEAGHTGRHGAIAIMRGEAR